MIVHNIVYFFSLKFKYRLVLGLELCTFIIQHELAPEPPLFSRLRL